MFCYIFNGPGGKIESLMTLLTLIRIFRWLEMCSARIVEKLFTD